ncbi:AraC family transcriptional regulator [uncultured Clostridium sp.]|uniref:AraC family transcriptional regulator n=1 Tax=uncultured Clostridium sp. TaxID=59620 RepID=UPI0025EEE698|nr:AraC family transcriptional regulator [uncultured Clostridium sp.]
MCNNNIAGIKKGYLNNNFKLFHIKDKINLEFDFHYHDFNKIIIFISGDVSYIIEGKSYNLKPWDILFVNNHDIHKPIVNSSQTYERIIIWINSKFLESHNYENCDLTKCFKLVDEKRLNLIRLNNDFQKELKDLIYLLESSLNSKEFGSTLLSNSLFIQLIIYLNRIHIYNKYIQDENIFKYDKEIENILLYINQNLSEDLSIGTLSQKFFISRYYLMHKFKKETGYTLHNYILSKRLFKAKELIKSGTPITTASMQCGFNDYSSFLRSFKKTFNCSPRELI